MNEINPRWISACVINNVTDGRSLSDSLAKVLPSMPDKRDRAFTQAICYGVCRHYATLDVILSHLLQRPMKAKDSDVHALLLVGLYQLIYMRVPPHSAVNETVNAVALAKKDWAGALVNAILRAYLRQQKPIEKLIQKDDEAVFAHPGWWLSATSKAWPDDWQNILKANNEHPPLALRVNQQKMDRDAYIKLCETSHELKAHAIPDTKHGVIIETPVAVEDLPGFKEGIVTVQDGAAQLAAEWLELASGQRVLDACAAPGGKLTHILEAQPDLAACVAVESDLSRIRLIKENLERLGDAKKIAECVHADAADVDAWWDGKPFDRILLDAPCSASGVIRRHPDIKLLREPGDILPMAKKQRTLLDALWPLLAPGGLLLYATCSIFPQENTDMLAAFLKAHPDAKVKEIDESVGFECAIGRQILPGMNDMDGFYYAKITKN